MRYLCLLFTVLLFAGCGGLTVDLGQEAVVAPELSDDQCCPDPDACQTREVLFFTQPGCSPCEEAKPKVEELRQKGVKITTINIREQPDLARQYRIVATPTFVVLENGVEIERTSSITVLITILIKLLAFLLPLMLG
jgi:thiol-disulfide isomerase/thioredoxin